MKLSTQEEYGLRCLIHLARKPEGESLTIPEISQAEGLSAPNVAKLMRLLRMGGMVQSVRGQSGGYTLARPASQISVAQVIDLLGGQFFSERFCERHAGRQNICMHTADCSLRVLWNTVQAVLHQVLSKTTVQDLLSTEAEMTCFLSSKAAGVFTTIGNAPPELTKPN